VQTNTTTQFIYFTVLTTTYHIAFCKLGLQADPHIGGPLHISNVFMNFLFTSFTDGHNSRFWKPVQMQSIN